MVEGEEGGGGGALAVALGHQAPHPLVGLHQRQQATHLKYPTASCRERSPSPHSPAHMAGLRALFVAWTQTAAGHLPQGPSPVLKYCPIFKARHSHFGFAPLFFSMSDDLLSVVEVGQDGLERATPQLALPNSLAHDAAQMRAIDGRGLGGRKG